MRHTIVIGIIASQLMTAALAVADDTTSSPVLPAPANTQTTTTTTVPSTPTGTTTTTQAAVDTSVAPPPRPGPIAEGGGETTTFVNRPLLASGLVLFAGSYVPAIGVAAESGRPSDNPNLYYPVVGPWMDLAQRDCSPARPCVNEAGNKALLIADGIIQDLGALATLTSFFVPEKKSRHWYVIGNDTVHVTPGMVAGAYGMAAVGRF